MPTALRAGRDLELRPLRLADAPALFALVDADRARLRRWLPWVDANTDVAHTRDFIEQRKRLGAQGLALTYLLLWQGEAVGVAAFNAIDRANRAGALGYWIASGFEGRGLMSRAVAALLEHGFGKLGLHRVEIRAAVRNRRSRAIPERLGFRHEGTLRQAERLGERYVDHAVYGLLAEDWARR